MRIVNLEGTYLATALRRLGHAVFTVGQSADCDLRLEHPIRAGRLRRALAEHGFVPDLALWCDRCRPPTVLSLERLPMATIGYSIDQYCNPWHVPLSAGFDVFLVAQRDYLPLFDDPRLAGRKVEWLQLFCDESDIDPGRESDIPAAFVGTSDPPLNPGRKPFLAGVRRLAPPRKPHGGLPPDFRTQPPRVLNQSAANELSFRVFQAMSCGAALLTEACGNGLAELFTPGKDLLTYARGDFSGAARTARAALADESWRSIAAAGKAKVRARHSAPQPGRNAWRNWRNPSCTPDRDAGVSKIRASSARKPRGPSPCSRRTLRCRCRPNCAGSMRSTRRARSEVEAAILAGADVLGHNRTHRGKDEGPRPKRPDSLAEQRKATGGAAAMAIHPLAGKPAPRELLADIPKILDAFESVHPDPENPAQQVRFGTSGHRGSSTAGSFNRDHILAVSQAICELRSAAGIAGPLFMGMDTHALSRPALLAALEVFAGNGVTVVLQEGLGYTPTPVVSHAILTHNRAADAPRADGVVVTPSHNPPADGGFKYNPPAGGPAGADVTAAIEKRANALLAAELAGVRRLPQNEALHAATTHYRDYVRPYVDDLGSVLDMEAIARAGLKLGADPLGGSGVNFLEPIAERWGLDLTVVNKRVDPAFSFMPVDHDGKIRMDCSSPYAMRGLIGLKDRFDVAFANDPDFDRHGIVTRGGLMNPNHYLAVAVDYLFRNRPGWRREAAVGKTLVSSSMIDRVAADLGRRLCEVPVGFKWFVPGLLDGSFGFGGEESAGASFLRRDGTVWTTDKDGIIMGLLAAEITARTGRDPGEAYAALEARFGSPVYERLDAPATAAQRAALKKLTPERVTASELAGEPILARLTTAPGNGAAIGGLKVVAQNGWFAARPSGTENIYKIYAESFLGREHLARIQDEARAIVSAAFRAAGAE